MQVPTLESFTITRKKLEWMIRYLAANLSIEECEDAETSITVQAMADFIKEFDPDFNKMMFAAAVRQAAQEEMEEYLTTVATLKNRKRSAR